MMAYEARDMSGSIFVNTKKEKDNHPDRTGSCMIDGVEYWMNGWMKKDKNGQPFMSISFKRKDAPSAAASQKTSRPLPDVDEDSIPF
jgi:hypothetical protein